MSRGWRRPTSRKFGLHRTGATKPLSHAAMTTFTYTYRTLWRSNTPVHWHFVYHTKADKPNKFLLQDITVFNEYDSTKLEDWLTDTETAADLTSESQAELTKAKSED